MLASIDFSASTEEMLGRELLQTHESGPLPVEI
jgi:hypothetical protein